MVDERDSLRSFQLEVCIGYGTGMLVFKASSVECEEEDLNLH